MLKKYFLAPLPALLLAATLNVQAQTGSVGIGTTVPDASAVLDVRTNPATPQGMLPPRLSQAARSQISSPATGLIIYNTSTNRLNLWNGTAWTELVGATAQAAPVAITFSYTGAPQTYTVPPGVTKLRVTANGAGGGNSNGGGGTVTADVPVVAGEVLTVYVGQRGTNSNQNTGVAGGYNGGGSVAGRYGASGGGATDLRRSATVPSTSLADRILVAGGAGGGSSIGGGDGGSGGNPGTSGGNPQDGGGGSGTQGGNGGSGSRPGQAGSLGQGGNGGSFITNTASGGGGGYYGGGGGGGDGNGLVLGSGGGGSSYVLSAATNVSYTTGGTSGNGSLTVQPIDSTPAPALDGTNFVNVPGDNLGNHTATKNLNLASYQLVGNGGSQGLTISSAGAVGIGGLLTAGSATINGATTIVGTTSINTSNALNTSIGNSTGALTLAGPTTITGATAIVGSTTIAGNATVNGKVGVGVTTPAAQFANTITNVLASDGNGMSTQGLGWTSTGTAGYAGVFYNASSGNGLAVKVAAPSAVALDVSQNAAAGTVGTPLLRVNGSGNVGLGTAAPLTRLSISQVAATSSTAGQNLGEISFVGYNRPNSSASIQALSKDSDDTGQLVFKTSPGSSGATERLRITADGNVGIGASVPGHPLVVQADGGNRLLGFNDAAGNDKYNFSRQAATTGTGAVPGGLNLSESNVAAGRLFVQDGGNVGIGTTTPSQKLDVAGNANVSGNATVSGNVGIGTSTPAGGLHVVSGNSGPGTGAGTAGIVMSGAASLPPYLELRGSGTGTSTTTPYLDFAETNDQDYATRLISQGGVLNVNGAGTNGVLLQVNGGLRAINYANISDARFKTSVRPIDGALASVLALRGVRYEWNALGVKHGGTAGASQVGVLAQEVEKIYPELVSTDAQGYKAVNYGQLTPVLIEALKEQQVQLEALKAANARVRAELQAIQAQAATDKAQATAALETFEARLRRLEAGSAQAQR